MVSSCTIHEYDYRHKPNRSQPMWWHLSVQALSHPSTLYAQLLPPVDPRPCTVFTNALLSRSLWTLQPLATLYQLGASATLWWLALSMELVSCGLTWSLAPSPLCHRDSLFTTASLTCSSSHPSLSWSPSPIADSPGSGTTDSDGASLKINSRNTITPASLRSSQSGDGFAQAEIDNHGR